MTGPQPDGGQTTLEAVLRALTNHRRRYILYHLREEEVSNLDEVARHIAKVEEENTSEERLDERVEQEKAALIHQDLPVLEDAALVEFDQRSEAVRYCEPPALLDKLLHICKDVDPSVELV